MVLDHQLTAVTIDTTYTHGYETGCDRSLAPEMTSCASNTYKSVKIKMAAQQVQEELNVLLILEEVRMMEEFKVNTAVTKDVLSHIKMLMKLEGDNKKNLVISWSPFLGVISCSPFLGMVSSYIIYCISGL